MAVFPLLQARDAHRRVVLAKKGFPWDREASLGTAGFLGYCQLAFASGDRGSSFSISRPALCAGGLIRRAIIAKSARMRRGDVGPSVNCMFEEDGRNWRNAMHSFVTIIAERRLAMISNSHTRRVVREF